MLLRLLSLALLLCVAVDAAVTDLERKVAHDARVVEMKVDTSRSVTDTAGQMNREMLNNLAEKINKLEHLQELDLALVEPDQEVENPDFKPLADAWKNSKKVTKWPLIVNVFWRKDFPETTSQREIATLQEQFFATIVRDAKISDDEAGHLQVVIVGPFEDDIDARFDAVFSSSRRLERLLHKDPEDTAGATAPPAIVEAGLSFLACPTASGRGTLGAIVKDGALKSYAFTNTHVLGNAACAAAPDPVVLSRAAAAAALPDRASLMRHLDNLPPTALNLYRNANPKWDVAWTRVKTGTKISCKIQAPSGGGKWASATIAGIRKPPPYGKQYGDDIPFTIFKFGQTTLGTKGQVISFYPMAKAAGTALNWGYRTVATWPDLPHDMTLFPTWRIDNLGAVRGSATPVPTTRALALDEGWEPRVMSYHGDSGSFVYDASRRVTCVQRGGRWETTGGVRRRVGFCYPWTLVEAEINNGKPAQQQLHVCTDARANYIAL